VPLPVPLAELVPLEVLERSALVPLLLDEARFAPEADEPAEFAPVLLLLPIPELELELASLRGEELLEPLPVLEPVPVLLPDAPAALGDSRTSDTITSGATSVAGKVTIATPKPFWMPPAPAPLADDEPDRPLPDVLERSLDELLVPVPEELLVPVPVEDELRSGWALLDEEAPMPPLEEEEPDRLLDVPPEVPLVSERRLLLPVPPVVLLALPLESTGQLLISAGLITSPWTMVRVS
jgi:hypothetical protein